MSNKNKLQRFADLHQFANTFENADFKTIAPTNYRGEVVQLRGQWASIFGNNNPIVLELACGKGDYALALALDNPDKNFIAVDIKGNRMWVGAKRALDENIPNVRFLRTQIEQIEHFFAPEEVAEIWITFPDPQLTKPRKRLTHPMFLERYRKLLRHDGLMHLKTDSRELYDFTLHEVIRPLFLPLHYSNPDIYGRALDFPELRHKTFYEQMHLQNKKKITYLRFGLAGDTTRAVITNADLAGDFLGKDF